MNLRKILFAASILAVFVAGYSLQPFHYVDTGYAQITWEPLTGEVGLLNQGWHVVSPLTLTTEIDTRPQRLCLPSDTHAAINCRLVQFDTTHYREFITTEGWRWYWWSNRLSFNSGYETYRGFRDVLRGYAFSANQYSFIKMLKE